MKHRAAGGAREIPQAGRTVGGFARHHLDIPEIAERFLPVDLAQHLQARDHRLAVDLLGKVIRFDARLVERIGRADRKVSARFRMALPDRRGEAGIAVQGIAGLVDRQRHHVELNVGAPADGVFRAGGAADLPRADRQRAAAGEHPLQSHLRQFDGIAHLVVQRDPLLQPHDQARLVVILQIAPDLRRVGHHRNAEPAQQIGRADAGKLENLRGLQRSGRQNDFAVGGRAECLVVLDPLDAGRDVLPETSPC